MPHYYDGQSVATLARRRTFSWRALFDNSLDTMRTWLRCWRERRELIEYLATDHRAALDIGIDGNAREWAERPFWRP